MNLHEELLVRSFFVRHRRNRILSLLGNKKRRKEALQVLAHLRDLDSRFAYRLDPNLQTPIAVERLLRENCASSTCYVISENTSIDGRIFPLAQALARVVGSGMGTLLSCIPGKLGYYESEDPTERYILKRPDT